MRKIIIDTDPGQDDALALMTAFGAKAEIKVLGVTCVAGNVPLDLTSINALKICELSGVYNVPVFKGSQAPLKRNLITAEHVHGKTGLDGTELSVKKKELELLKSKFLDLKNLIYEYKDNKEKEIQTLMDLHNNLKKEVEDVNESYSKIIDDTTKEIDDFVDKINADSSVQ